MNVLLSIYRVVSHIDVVCAYTGSAHYASVYGNSPVIILGHERELYREGDFLFQSEQEVSNSTRSVLALDMWLPNLGWCHLTCSYVMSVEMPLGSSLLARGNVLQGDCIIRLWYHTGIA